MRATRTRTIGLAPIAAGVLAVAALIAAGPPIWTAPTAQAAAEPVVVATADFEDGTTQNWAPRADEAVANSTETAHGGTHSLAVTGRTRTWEGPSLDVLGTMAKGTRYTISVWVRLAAGAAADAARLSVERRSAGTSSYDQVVGDTPVTDADWVNLTGQYTLAADVEFLAVYVETANGTASLHIDDFTLSYVPLPPIQTDIPAVRDVLAPYFPVGAAVSGATLLGNHAQLLTKHFNSVTPGNALKWDATQPTEGEFRFAEADEIVAFATANGMAIRGHTLVWHQQTPAWVFQDADGAPLTPTPEHKALLLGRLDAHIRAVLGRYAGQIDAWDVVNEVIDENEPDGLRRSTWYQITGLDYIRTAFRVAREVDPTAKLYINDYNTNVPAKRDKLYALVSQLRAEGVPVDGVGHQMHGNVDWPSAAETEAMLTTFAPLGVAQQITEMDISIYVDSGESFPTPPAERLTRQAERYGALFDVYRRHAEKLTSVTLWGLADDDTWLDTHPVTRNDAPLLFDEQLQAKPAYWAVVGTASPTATASATASPTTGPTGSTAPDLACQITYAVVGQWPGGFQANVTVTNTGGTPVDGWTVRWSFAHGQRVDQLWNGVVSQHGAEVTVTNVAWNGSLPPGASETFGFLGGWTGQNAAPTEFTLNGHPCRSG